MRRTFAEVLRSSGIDVQAEYNSLQSLVFERYGLYTFMDSHFREVWFADTAISLEDFNKRHNFDFDRVRSDASLDDLLDLCEYAYNFADVLTDVGVSGGGSCWVVLEHINTLVDKLGYTDTRDDGFVVFVPRDENIVAAAKVAPTHVAQDMLRYGYRGFEGDLGEKKSMLVRMLGEIEPKRKELERLSKSLATDLFYIANNFNLRHNNIDPSDRGKYRPHIAEMGENELEGWYDVCRDLCAASFLLLDYSERKSELDELKQQMVG
ncbi:MAG: hypothetical protein IKF78_10635 [Atopobiaceae bacterium]|nr:hypothetical protein [Atopobiaceae bacterium]